MNKKQPPESAKPRESGFLLVLTVLALITWLLNRFFSWGRATKPVLSKKAQKLQWEIETLEILQEQAKLDLRRVRHEQQILHSKETSEAQSDLPDTLNEDHSHHSNEHVVGAS